jgi:hypothetical protein
VRIAEAVEAQAVEIRRDRRGWRRRRTRSLPLAGDNLLPRTLAVIPHRPVLHHRHRGNDNDRTYTDRSGQELLLQRKVVRWKKQTTRWRTTND